MNTFHDTVPTDLGGLGPEAPSITSAEREHTLAVEFTGSGSEYFRIWIVNLLLVIVTLTLYQPFAKARRLAYFHANTRVGGHALGFHGNPWKMLRGYLLVAAMGAAFAAAQYLSPVATLVALGLFAALWPALWRASLQFRLGNTSWRGLRFGFDGSLGGAYAAVLPMVLPLLVLIAAGAWAGFQQAAGEAPAPPPWWLGLLGLLLPLATPWGLASVKRYQHGGYHFGGQTTRLDAGVGAFYLWALKVAGVGVLLVLLLAGVFGAGLLGSLGGLGGMGRGAPSLVGVIVLLMLSLVFYLLMFAVIGPFAVSRLQNLVWGRTASRRVAFRSELKLWPFVRLNAVNFILTVFTLGLYRPFAAVNSARMRLAAVQVLVRGDVEQWVARQSQRADDATGDAAGDFFGIDLGL